MCIVEGIQSKLCTNTTCFEIKIRQLRVTHLQPRVTGATKRTEPNFTPTPEYPTEIQVCFNFADAITSETGVATKCDYVALLENNLR